MLRTKTGQLILSALAIVAYLLATATEAAPATTAVSLVGGAERQALVLDLGYDWFPGRVCTETDAG